MNESRLKEFCSRTTAHGFSHLDVSCKSERHCWLVIIIFAFMALAFHLYAVVAEFFEYQYHETTVTSTDVYPWFPDVTVCDSLGLAETSIAK